MRPRAEASAEQRQRPPSGAPVDGEFERKPCATRVKPSAKVRSRPSRRPRVRWRGREEQTSGSLLRPRTTSSLVVTRAVDKFAPFRFNQVAQMIEQLGIFLGNDFNQIR